MEIIKKGSKCEAVKNIQKALGIAVDGELRDKIILPQKINPYQ